MMAEVVLLDDGPSSVAIRAPHLALGNLALEGCDRHFAVSELNHSISLHADVVEVEHRDIGFAAVHAGRSLQVVSDEEEVATAQRPGVGLSPNFRVGSPRTRATPGTSPMAVRTYEFAVRNFCDHSL
jgi:hypothetical protein